MNNKHKHTANEQSREFYDHRVKDAEVDLEKAEVRLRGSGVLLERAVANIPFADVETEVRDAISSYLDAHASKYERKAALTLRQVERKFYVGDQDD